VTGPRDTVLNIDLTDDAQCTCTAARNHRLLGSMPEIDKGDNTENKLENLQQILMQAYTKFRCKEAMVSGRK
jgi:hypothetical protein